MVSPTARTLNHLRELDYTCQVVERWNQFAHKKQDLFGFIDIVAIKKYETGVLGIQCTTTSHQANRRQKILDSDISKIWLLSDNTLEVWGWKKVKNRWQVVRTKITLEDFK